MEPLFSFITTVYNNERFLKNAVESILGQDFDDFEYILVDDGSTDKTPNIIDELAQIDERIRVIHQENRGIYESFNRGIRASKGKYLFILNSDDKLRSGSLGNISRIATIYHPDVIYTQICIHICDNNQKDTKAAINYGGCIPDRFISSKSDFSEQWIELYSKKYLFNQANFYKADLAKKILFKEDIYGADRIFNYEYSKFVKKAYVIEKPIYEHYLFDDKRNASYKYYQYSHKMFNEFYAQGCQILDELGISNINNQKLLKEERVENLISGEYSKLLSPNCNLSTEERIKKIFVEYMENDIQQMINSLGKREEVERFALRTCKKLLEYDDLSEDSQFYFVKRIIHGISSSKVNDKVASDYKSAVNNSNNPFKIGESYLNNVESRLSNNIARSNDAKRILWLCNIVLPDICDHFLFKHQEVGGWIDGLWQNIKNDPDLDFAICVPIHNKENCQDGILDNYRYYSFVDSMSEALIPEMQQRFEEIIEDYNPDVIHIWGTEYPHTYGMALAAEKYGLLDKTIVHIQGLVSAYYHYYYSGLNKDMVSDIELMKSLDIMSSDFKERSIFEKKALEKVGHVLGRTGWDWEWMNALAPQATYHSIGEILRNEIYENAGKWSYGDCTRHTIFMGQASYPIKGLHLVLEVLASLKDCYPDLKVRIAGSNPLMQENGYSKYLKKRIYELDLQNTIEFIGLKNAVEMVEEYVRANVFLSASTIENSPNSVCEAMMIGVPVVASDVGGVSSLIDSDEAGLLYPIRELEIMESRIKYLFDNVEYAKQASLNACMSIKQKANREKIVKGTKEVYIEI